MNPTSLIRDAARVHACIVELPTGALVAKSPVKIYVPKRFEDKRLAIIGSEVQISGIYAMVTEDGFYAVSKALAMMYIKPTSTTLVDVAGDACYEFSFDKGSTVVESVDLVKKSGICYQVYDEIIAKGNIPWFFSGEDVATLFLTSQYHAGVKLSVNNAPMEIIAAAISRDPNDPKNYYRFRIKSIDEQYKIPPRFIAFRNVIYGATNTTARLMGSYFDDGLMSALVNPSEQTENVENFLRG